MSAAGGELPKDCIHQVGPNPNDLPQGGGEGVGRHEKMDGSGRRKRVNLIDLERKERAEEQWRHLLNRV